MDDHGAQDADERDHTRYSLLNDGKELEVWRAATGRPSSVVIRPRDTQFYYKKIVLRSAVMLLLLFVIFGGVYIVVTVDWHGGNNGDDADHIVRSPNTLPELPIIVQGHRGQQVHGRQPQKFGIVNGGAAEPGQFPWLADIQVVDTGQSRCGGSLIDVNWVITAAHCVSTIESGDLRFAVHLFQIVIGEHDIAVHDEFEQIRTIQKVVIEPDFSKRSALPNDIALVQLNKPAVLNQRVAVIQLSRNDSGFSACSVAGWGATGVDPMTGQPVYPTALQHVDMTLLTLSACQHRLVGYSITVNMTCAEGQQGAAVCWGDSGGSLTCPPVATSTPWTLVGITSWGVACGYMQYPSVYTRVSRFIPWIESVTGIQVDGAPLS